MPVSGTLYTYPNNFRAQKALIAAKYSGANVKLAKNFSLTETVKDKAFLAKFPFGKVPAFEDDSGLCLFESSAIAFHVASDDLRGKDNVQRALVQQWVSFADNELLPAACSWVFPVVGVMDQCKELTDRAAQDLKAALNVLDQYLLNATFLAGERITLADICVACTLLLPFQNVLDPAVRKNYKNLTRWFTTIVNQPKVKEVLGEVKLCEKVGEPKKAAEPKKAEKKAAEPKSQKKADKKKDDDDDMGDDDLLTAAEKKPKDPLDLLPKGAFDMDDFKRFYSNNEEVKSVPYFWEKFDKEHYSIWKCDYKYNHELAMVFMSCNLIGGMYQRLDKMRKNAFASMCLFGENNNSTISGIWIWRGQDLAFDLCEDWQIDYTSYDWKKLDANSDETKKLVDQYFKWIGTDAEGRKFNQGKIFK